MSWITFTPIYMERVWGGRSLESIYRRELPTPDLPYGEAWELVDREEAQSIVNFGEHAGKSLHDLWLNHREEIFGAGLPDHPRFPILLKILDCREVLSIQVHPPEHMAETLGGEPKSEMWVIADCEPHAELYVGLKAGVGRTMFERAITDGTTADCVHTIRPDKGDSIMIPSGRLHAIGAGFLIHEIQQNSDTTYRVFDWNRLGLDGRPRTLHIEESLASIDFDDVEPGMDQTDGRTLANGRYFLTERFEYQAGAEVVALSRGQAAIFSILSGMIRIDDGREFHTGATLLMPAHAPPATAIEATVALRITIPPAS